jgi:hypothetical protein
MKAKGEVRDEELDDMSTPATEEQWDPPVSAKEAKKLSKRERLELVKPHLRAHYASPRDETGACVESWSRRRWSWIYDTLNERLDGGDLAQARNEIYCEDRYGHYWAPASISIDVIQHAGWRYEAEAYYPRGIHESNGHHKKSDAKRFRFRWMARLWLRRRERSYERYVRRLLREGLYDDWRYE